MPDPRPARELMDRFAAATGLTHAPRDAGRATDGASHPRRYLWTDAFAVCSWIGLGEIDRARDLVDRVHFVLGRHRDDDPRDGWISGLPDEEGPRRPTAGGLRIGKPLPERPAEQPYDPQLEWERDGQYFHYLTRWMRALLRLGTATGDDRYHAWSAELARVAFDRFSHGIGPAPNRLHWKMSIDLSRAQVPSMGQHDPLDGYVAMREIQAYGDQPDLGGRMAVLAGMAEGSDWVTEDPLGAGSLLTDAWFLARAGDLGSTQLRILQRVLDAATASMREVRTERLLELPAARRLAFREIGLAIGLAALERLTGLSGVETLGQPAVSQLDELRQALPMRDEITGFWLEPDHHRVASWLEHEDINTVMLATAVEPAGYLDPV